MNSTKAVRGRLFSMDDRHDINSSKSDHCSWSKWCVFVFEHLGQLIGEDMRPVAWGAFSKYDLGIAYEENLTAKQAAEKIAKTRVSSKKQ